MIRLTHTEYYKPTSKEDRLDMIETIYRIDPNFIHVVTYNNRNFDYVYDHFPLLVYNSDHGKISGYSFDINRHEITKEEFLSKLQKKIDNIRYPINLKYKF